MKLFRKRVITDNDGEPYIVRYILFRVPWFGIFLHHIMRSDYDRALHDHPWGFISIILTGAYKEHTPQGVQEYRRGAILFRPAKWLHRLELSEPMWSLVIVGRKARKWGFMVDQSWCWWRKYNTVKGICEEDIIFKDDEVPEESLLTI